MIMICLLHMIILIIVILKIIMILMILIIIVCHYDYGYLCDYDDYYKSWQIIMVIIVILMIWPTQFIMIFLWQIVKKIIFLGQLIMIICNNCESEDLPQIIIMYHGSIGFWCVLGLIIEIRMICTRWKILVFWTWSRFSMWSE